MNLDKLLLDLAPKKAAECKGLFYRCNVNSYVHQGRYVHQLSMRPLKRMSCSGCKQCDCLKEDLHEFSTGGYTLPIINNPENGKIYKLAVTNLSTDWETGYMDDWDLEFQKVDTHEPTGE